MKNLLTLLVFFSFYVSNAYACFPNGVTFSTQQEVDDFYYQSGAPYTDYCQIIEGDVTINGNNITNLSGLRRLQKINGTLVIRNCSNLLSILGLKELDFIGGDFIFDDNNQINSFYGLSKLLEVGGNLQIVNNDILLVLYGKTPFGGFTDGLKNLHTVGGGIIIENNLILANLGGLIGVNSTDGDLSIKNNAALVSIEGLAGISENVHNIDISENIVLIDLMGLHNITNISGAVIISGNNLLVDCNGLDGLSSVGDLIITFNDSMQSLESLSNLMVNAGVLSIQGNINLHDLNGLSNLTEVGSIIFFNNPNLEEITDLHDITSIDGGIYIEQNNSLTSLQGLDNISINGMYEVYIFDNTQLSICDIESICNYLDSGEPVYIDGNASGCATEEEVDEACSPPYCPQLISPQDGDVDVDLFTNISWEEDDNADGYIISIGSTPYGTDLLDTEDVGNTTSYQHEGGFSCSSTIHVRVLGYNDKGLSLDCAETVFTAESVSITMISEINVCQGESVILEPNTNGTSISWSPTEGLDDPNSFSPTANPESNITYVATVYSAFNNCTALSFVNVIVLDEIYIDLYDFGGVTCPSECTGEIAAIGGGGSPPYQYLWNTGETSIKLIGVCGGSYLVTVTDSEGCAEEQEMIVYEYPDLYVESAEIVHVTDTELGSISLVYYLNSNQYTINDENTFEWKGVGFEYYSNEASIDNLNPGCYRLTTFGGSEECSIDTVFCVEDNTIGINEQGVYNDEIDIYPNPTTSKLNIEFLKENITDATIGIINLSGIELQTFHITSERKTIDLSSFKPGFYLIKVIDGKRQYYKKIAVIR